MRKTGKSLVLAVVGEGARGGATGVYPGVGGVEVDGVAGTVAGEGVAGVGVAVVVGVGKLVGDGDAAGVGIAGVGGVVGVGKLVVGVEAAVAAPVLWVGAVGAVAVA